MYVKVHQKGNQWFREDTKALVGPAIDSANILNALKSIYGTDKNFATSNSNGTIIIIYHGYYDSKGIFNHFCEKHSSCHKCNPVIKETFCYRRSKAIKSSGYYIKA